MAGAKPQEPAQRADSGLDSITQDKDPWMDLMCVAAPGTQAHKLSDRPMMLPCGHRMCYECFQSYTQDTDKTGHVTCISGDTDCEPIIIKKVRPDTFAAKEIKGLRYGSAGKERENKADVDQAVMPNEALGGRIVGSKWQSGKNIAAPKRSLLEITPQEQIKDDSLAQCQHRLKVVHNEVTEYMRKVVKISLELNRLSERAQKQEDIINRLQRDSATYAAKIGILVSRTNEWATQEELEQQKSGLSELRLRLAGDENGMNTVLPASGVANMFRPMLLNDDGRCIWKIKNYQQWKTQAQEQTVVSITSDPFATPRPGYLMRARAYIYGDGRGVVGKCISLYVQILKGKYDELMQWPFNQKVTFTVKAQKVNGDKCNDIVKIVTFDKNLLSCQRPGEDPNPAFGLKTFVMVADIEASKTTYLDDDTLFLEITVS